MKTNGTQLINQDLQSFGTYKIFDGIGFNYSLTQAPNVTDSNVTPKNSIVLSMDGTFFNPNATSQPKSFKNAYIPPSNLNVSNSMMLSIGTETFMSLFDVISDTRSNLSLNVTNLYQALTGQNLTTEHFMWLPNL